MKKLLKLKSSDNVIFEVDEATATKIGTIKAMMDDGVVCNSDGNVDLVIPLVNVKSEILCMIVEWCKKHTTNDDDNINNNSHNKDELKAWDAEFVKDIDQAILYHLLMAADYMNVTELVDILITKVANMIKGKKAEEIREKFKIKNDFTPEQQEEIRKKNLWAFD